MATTNTALYNKQVAAGSSPVLPTVLELGAKLRFARVETTVAALAATGDVLRLCNLPAGSRVLPCLSKIAMESPGTTVTLSIGDASSSTRYMASKAFGGAVADAFWSSAAGADTYVGVNIVAGNETILLTSITIGTPTASAKINILIAYLNE